MGDIKVNSNHNGSTESMHNLPTEQQVSTKISHCSSLLNNMADLIREHDYHVSNILGSDNGTGKINNNSPNTSVSTS